MKRIISFILTPVLALSLCFPMAFAAPALPPEVETAEPMDMGAPRYALYPASYTIDMQNNTYADLVFTMAVKGATTYFEDIASISFRTTNPNGSHWKVLEYSYSISDEQFYLYVTLQDMDGNTPSSYYGFDMSYIVLPSMITGRSLSAEDGSGVVLIPESIDVRYIGGTEEVLSAKDENGVVLIPESVNVRYVGEMNNN